MKAEELFEAIGEIDDTLILRSGRKSRTKNLFRIYGGIAVSAACLALLFGVNQMSDGLFKVSETNIGSSSQETEGDGNGMGDFDAMDSEAEVFVERTSMEPGMAPELDWVEFNPGPIMPMTFAEQNDAIEVKRELVYDFTAAKKEDAGYVPIGDKYVLTNTSDKEQMVCVYYPYMSDIKELTEKMPQVVVDGEEKKTTVLNGDYLGYDSSGMPRMFTPDVSTDEYSYMVNEVKPMTANIDEELMEKTISAYEFSDFESGDIPADAATYFVKFKVNHPDKVFTSNATFVDYDGEYLNIGFVCGHVHNQQMKAAVYFMEEAPTEVITQGYGGVDMDKDAVSDEVSAKMTKCEVTVKEVLNKGINQQLMALDENGTEISAAMKELYYQRVAQMFSDMYQWSNDGKSTAEDEVFYENSISDIVYMAFDYESFYLLSDTVTIPAGGSSTVKFLYEKAGAHQCYEPTEQFRDNYCYDNMPNLGTNLNYVEQNVEIKENGNISIEDQNYGFDLEKGIKKVTLELDAERYYMIVKILQ